MSRKGSGCVAPPTTTWASAALLDDVDLVGLAGGERGVHRRVEAAADLLEIDLALAVAHGQRPLPPRRRHGIDPVHRAGQRGDVHALLRVLADSGDVVDAERV